MAGSKTSDKPSQSMEDARSSLVIISKLKFTEQLQNFDAHNFNLETVLSDSRCKVYLDYYKSSQIALKTADVSKSPGMLLALLNEVAAYEQLSDLQGRGIPKLLFHGYLDGIIYCIGLSVCGVVAEKFTEQQKQRLLDILDCIHRAGILHSDIRKEKILVDECGNPYLVGFGMSLKSDCPDDQRREMNELRRLIELF